MDKLSPRLDALYKMVRGMVCADVGTDHALLPCALVARGKCRRAVASDIRRGPLEAAARAVAAAGLDDRIELVLCDGLPPGSGADSVVIAGMGGENIADILCRADIRDPSVQLVLQPMSKIPLLRGWLNGSGYTIHNEVFVREDGRVYVCMEARYGAEGPYTPLELQVGRFCAGTDGAAALYRRRTLLSLTKRRDGLAAAGAADAAGELQLIIDELTGA